MFDEGREEAVQRLSRMRSVAYFNFSRARLKVTNFRNALP